MRPSIPANLIFSQPVMWLSLLIPPWANACASSTKTTPIRMGQQAGRNMAGANEPYDHLSYFYSDLFELGYEAVGELDSRLETFVDWKDELKKV